ncbi:MAG: hypothetical protein J6X85_03495 [Ruminococcus sp.]|nr:hypothetical protein [Ruminococcus sp.]
MKKVLGILFLLAIVAAGVCAYLFPGIPYKYKCTHELELTDSIWENVPEDIEKLPAEYASYSNFGLRLTAWEDMKPVRTDSKEKAQWQNGDEYHIVSIATERINESDDFLDRTGISHEALERYCKAVEKTTPENQYEFMKLVASLTMDDFDIHDFKNSKTFYLLMKVKNDMYLGEKFPAKLYCVDGVGYRGFLYTEKSQKNTSAIINIYPDRDKSSRYTLEVSVADWNETIAIAKSIKLT